jgi:hypothetical protein
MIGVNAFAYMLLARMIHFYLPIHSIFSIPASVLAIAFVTLDFISFVIQLIGGSYAGPTAPMTQQLKGVHIYMGGIGLQQLFIFLFLALGVKFHREMFWLERVGSAKEGWKGLLFTLYGSLGFITVCFPPLPLQSYHKILIGCRSVSSSVSSSSPAARHLPTLFHTTKYISMS